MHLSIAGETLLLFASVVGLSWLAGHRVARWPRVRLKPGRRAPDPDRLTLLLVFGLAGPLAAFWSILPLSLQEAVALLCFAVLLATQAGHDFRRGLLPLPENAAIAVLGLLALVMGWLPVLDAVAGSALGVGAFALLNLAWHRWRGQAGFGGGDIRLMAGLGLWVGLSGLAFLLVGAALGGLLAAWVIKARDRIAFGPWLAFSGWSVVLLKILDIV